MRREIYIPLHSWTVKKRPFCDKIWSGLQNFFLELLKTRNLGSATALIHHIPKLNMTASTGILNLGIRKPCLLIFFSMLEEVVASRVILLKMTISLLETHFPNPMNAARALRLWSREKCSRCPITLPPREDWGDRQWRRRKCDWAFCHVLSCVMGIEKAELRKKLRWWENIRC